MPEDHASLSTLIRYLRCCIAYGIMMVVLASAVVYSSQSRTAAFPLLMAVGGLICLSLMLYTMKAATRGDVQRYPYGTGRLENVCAILLSLLISSGSLMLLAQVLQGFWLGQTRTVQMGWTFLLLLVSATGNGFNAFRARHLRRTTDNPILTALHHMYHAGMVRDCCSSILIGLLWLLKSDNPVFMSRLDSFATIAFALYSLSRFLPQIWANFRALADFPLNEGVQLKIMAILGRHFEAYEMLGRIYSTRRGGTPVFEVELEFQPSLPLAKIIELERAMRQDFQQEFPGCIFRIIPSCTQPRV